MRLPILFVMDYLKQTLGRHILQRILLTYCNVRVYTCYKDGRKVKEQG
nr:MAG TPA: hypothetical protein [Caudoviricetes sp.]DAW60061.1 MAG TPA: hypothetical protein [Caudoviricetes sp.]